MRTIKGPGLFIAQFLGDQAPFNSLNNIAKWSASLGYKGLQIPTLDSRFIDLKQAADSRSYCDDLLAILDNHGLQLTELSTHLQGQLVAVHPAYDMLFDAFAPSHLHGKPDARQKWAVDQLMLAAKASANFGLTEHVSFSGSLAWPYTHPWPQQPEGLIDTAFNELASRWLPILNAFDEAGVNICYEIHPGEDLHDGITFEMFLERVNNHPRCNMLYDPSHFVLQAIKYIEHIDIYHERIKMFHVKDAELNPTGRVGVYGGYQQWVDRAARYRAVGDGQVDWNTIFSKLAQYGYEGWAIAECECALKHPNDDARDTAKFISDHIIRVTDHAFDDFVKTSIDNDGNKSLLGLS